MTATVALAGAYTATLNRLADHSQATLERIYTGLGSWDDLAADQFHSLAKPLVTATAQAAMDATAGYLVALGTEPAPPSDLVVADAAARCYDPFDRLGHDLLQGLSWDDAVAGGRSAASALGDDAVFRTARNGLAQMGVDMRNWQRRLSSGCCQWCMKLSHVVFDSAGQATFGHAHCRCVPVPVDAIGDYNAAIRDANGFDPEAERRFDQRHATNNLRKQIRTADRRQAEAQRQLLTEQDPARRDRLETRVQEWETRGEAARERLRIAETGSHRLAA